MENAGTKKGEIANEEQKNLPEEKEREKIKMNIPQLQAPTVIGKVNLDAINSKLKPKKKTREELLNERAERNRVTREKQAGFYEALATKNEERKKEREKEKRVRREKNKKELIRKKELEITRLKGKKRIVFIVNPHAGMGYYKKVARLLKKRLNLSKYDYDLVLTQYRGHGHVLALEAAKEGVNIIVAVGGDGTINEIARALVDKNVALGFIPTGSCNGLAHHLKIPTRISKAIQVINNGYTMPIDTLKINDHICISIAGLGFDGLVAELFAHSTRRGFFPYLNYITKSYPSYVPQTYFVEEEGKEREEHEAMLVSIANSSQWGFNVKVSPEASMEDGYADICFVKKPNFFMFPFSTTALLTGNLHKDKKNVHIYRLSECTIYTKDEIKQPCHIDGDPIEQQNKIAIKVLPKSLQIITTKKFV